MHRRFNIRRFTQIGRLVHIWISVAATLGTLWPGDWPSL
jgi:hypothetical protein